MTYPSVICTVDVVLFALLDRKLCVGLHRREKAPFEGELALPGGFVHADKDKTLKHSALRVMRDKVGSDKVYLEQLATFSGQDRDPRGWSLSVAYVAAVPEVYARQDGLALSWVPISELPAELPFMHHDIVALAVSRLQGKGHYTSLPVMFLADRAFTLPELQLVFEYACGIVRDKVTFRRKMLEMGILEELEEKSRGARSRPAALYRIKPEFQLELVSLERTF